MVQTTNQQVFSAEVDLQSPFWRLGESAKKRSRCGKNIPPYTGDDTSLAEGFHMRNTHRTVGRATWFYDMINLRHSEKNRKVSSCYNLPL